MSLYPPPITFQTIFNPENYLTYEDPLTLGEGNNTYLIKIGTDSDYGIANFTKQINLSNSGLRFINDLNTGIYLAGTSDMRIAVASFDRLRIQSSLITSNPQVRITTGNVSNPHLQFNASSSAGIHSSSASNISFVANAANIARLENSATATSNGLFIENAGISGYTPQALYCYESITQSNTVYIGGNTQSITLILTKIGALCSIHIPNFALANLTAGSASPTIDNLPARFACNTTSGNGLYFGTRIFGSSTKMGIINIVGTSIYFFQDTFNATPAGQGYTFYGASITYVSA